MVFRFGGQILHDVAEHSCCVSRIVTAGYPLIHHLGLIVFGFEQVVHQLETIIHSPLVDLRFLSLFCLDFAHVYLIFADPFIDNARLIGTLSNHVFLSFSVTGRLHRYILHSCLQACYLLLLFLSQVNTCVGDFANVCSQIGDRAFLFIQLFGQAELDDKLFAEFDLPFFNQFHLGFFLCLKPDPLFFQDSKFSLCCFQLSQDSLPLQGRSLLRFHHPSQHRYRFLMCLFTDTVLLEGLNKLLL